MMSKHHEWDKQYFVAIIPPSPILEEAQRLKGYFRDNYRSRAALNSPPHITLHMPFLWNEQKENHLVKKIGEFAQRFDPVKVCLDNFSSFPPRVIFIAVTESDALDALQKELHRFFKRELDIFNANYKDRPFHPHLTLAFRDLKPAIYKTAMEEFSGKEFKAEFMADKIAILKHDGKQWNVLTEIQLGSNYAPPTAHT